ncbi:acyltransferase family protein [Nostoc sp.]
MTKTQETNESIQNSKFKIKDSHATCGWGFYLPWETMILSLRDATANAPLAGVSVAGRSTVLNLTSFHKKYFNLNYYWHHFRNFHDWLILPAFSLVILGVSFNNNSVISKVLNSQLMLYIGTISYSTYMVHWFVQELLKLLLLYNFNEVFGTIFTNYQALTSLGLFLMIVLLSASLTYRFIEVPERNYLNSTIVGK